jgi:hypothetical protein
VFEKENRDAPWKRSKIKNHWKSSRPSGDCNCFFGLTDVGRVGIASPNLFGGNPKILEKMFSERHGDRNVARVVPTSDQDAPNLVRPLFGRIFLSIMNHPLNPNNGSADPTDEGVEKWVHLWFAVAVIGLFVFACFYVLKVAVDLFLPIVLAGFLGFLLTPITRWLKKIGLPNFWAPLVGTLGFFTLLMCLFAALCASLARFQPDLPLYLDHIQERLTPILQAVQKSSPSVDRLGAWLNPGKILQVNIRGPSFLELALKNAPKFFAILLIVHVLAFFLLLYGARLLKKLVDMIPGVSEKQNVIEIAAEIEQTAARYFTSVTLINACVGVSVWVSVGLLGLPIRCSGVWLLFCSITFPS